MQDPRQHAAREVPGRPRVVVHLPMYCRGGPQGVPVLAPHRPQSSVISSRTDLGNVVIRDYPLACLLRNDHISVTRMSVDR
jgi:hypothetical protein